MYKKNKNKSIERDKGLEQKSFRAKPLYDRNCHTPSLRNNFNHQKKKTKSKDKSNEPKSYNFSSVKQVKLQQPIYNYHIPMQKKDSPFKHKNRPISNLNNARHAKNIQHQLSNLNQSIARNQPVLNESNKKFESVNLRSLDQGKKCMKNNHFEKAIKHFQQTINSHKDNIQAFYLLGVSYYHLESYEEAIKYFTNVLLKQSHYRKNIYLFLAISYKKLNLLDDALATLSKTIQLYPKYYDAIILRSKLLSKQKRYYDAIEDLNKCIKLEPQNLQAYISKADCLRSIAQYNDAIKIYSEVLSLTYDEQILLKRAITYIQSNDTELALNDLNKLISKNHTNAEAYLFKGLAYSKTKNYNDAILSYEQCIKYNSLKKATTKALYQISKLKIEMGDYYGANYNLERAPSLDVDMKVLEKLKMFAEGSTFIMKKKYKKGIENMNILIKRQHLSQQIKPLIYAFRAYGYFCQYKFINAVADLKTLTKNGYKLDCASQYNQLLLQGIIASQNNNFKQAKIRFQTAKILRNNFSDPYVYQSLTYIAQYNRTKKKDNYFLKQALKSITVALQKQDNYNSYYICSCILFTLNNMPDALINIQKAIDKSDDHVMKHFYLRGLIKAMMHRYKQTLNDCNNVLSLMKDLKQKQQTNDPDQPEKQKQILQVYLNRAKCYLLFDQKKKAFQDLQTYISCKPLDSQIHIVAGKLLFSIGACQDAVKAYSYSPNIQKHRQNLLQRMKCYLVLKQLNMCLKDMEKLIQMGDPIIKYDYCCLSSLKEASKNSQANFKEAMKKILVIQTINIEGGYIFGKSDMIFYKGLFHFYLGNFEEAQKLFNISKTMKMFSKQLPNLEIRDKESSFNEQLFQNRIFSADQIEYNIALCDLMLQKYQVAEQVLKKYDSFNLIFSAQDNLSTDQIDVTPFPISNRLCSIFPQVTYQQNINFRISFCLPTISTPEIKFEIQIKIIEQLNMNSTQTRPDAPWIKRNTFGVIFTDEIIGFDVDINTEKSVKNDPIKIQTEEDEKNKMKEILALDQDLESKLARILKKRSQ